MGLEIFRDFIEEGMPADLGVFLDEGKYSQRQSLFAFNILKSIIPTGMVDSVIWSGALHRFKGTPFVRDLYAKSHNDYSEISSDITIAFEWVKAELNSQKLITEYGDGILFKRDDLSIAQTWDMLVGFAYSAGLEQAEVHLYEIAASEVRSRIAA